MTKITILLVLYTIKFCYTYIDIVYNNILIISNLIINDLIV